MKLELLGFVLVVVAASAAYGQKGDYINSDRPGIADSSEVVGARRFQIETGITREKRRAGEDPERNVFVPTLLRLGINEQWEARFESDVYAWMRVPGGARAAAYAPASLGLKYQFLEADGALPSLGAIARVSPPSGSNTLRIRHTTGDLRVAADWELSRQWSLNPNVGLGIDEDDQGQRLNTKLFAITLAYKPVPTLELFVDMGAQRPEAKRSGSAVIYDAGFGYLASHDVQLDVSLGVRGTGATAPRSFLAAGVSLRF